MSRESESPSRPLLELGRSGRGDVHDLVIRIHAKPSYYTLHLEGDATVTV